MSGLPFDDPEVTSFCEDMAAVANEHFPNRPTTARKVYDEFVRRPGVSFERADDGSIVVRGLRLKTDADRRESIKPKGGLVGGPNDNGPPPLAW